MDIKYSIQREITTTYIVCAERTDSEPHLIEPVARCNTLGVALTIKGMYEKAEAEDKDNG